ncbi:MAG: ATP-binding cassette domain-containing protein [Firmicutes bacterium]|nr:ATP-binding cassette domain-containing protein [Bacillota bacterium]
MIKLVNITKKFKNRILFEKINLEFYEGTNTWIIGPSGAGKTTILRIIAGLLEPDEGFVFQNGKLVVKKGFHVHPSLRNLGFVFQSHALWPHMTVYHNIAFGIADMDKKEQSLRVHTLLEGLGLKGYADRYPSELSAGEAGRVSIARMLAHCPKLLLMDEPFSNLDDESRKNVYAFVREWIAKQKTTLICVTHNKEDISAFQGNVIILKNGVVNKLF